MKKSLLLTLIALGLFYPELKAQWAEAGTLKNFTWDYSFSGGSGTQGGKGLEIFSTPSTENFLPKPPSGEVRVSTAEVSTTAGSSFTLNGTCGTSCLTMVHTSANLLKPAPAKFVARNFAASSRVMSAHFKMNLNHTSENKQAIWYLVVGKADHANFNDKDSAPTISSNSEGDSSIYTVLRFRKTAVDGKYSLQARYRGTDPTKLTTWGWQTVSGVSLDKDTEYKIDLFFNNNSVTENYTINGVTKSLAAEAYHIYIDGVLRSSSNLTRNQVYRTSTKIYEYAGNLSGFSIMSREAAQSVTSTGETVDDNSASLVLSGLSIVHKASTLPVTLTDFSGKTTDRGIALNWKTVSETNNSHFLIKRSGSGADFSTLDQIEGKGTTSAVSHYNYLDEKPLSGTNYYKLEQIDLNGTKTVIDKIVSIKHSIYEEVFSVSAISDTKFNVIVSSEKDESGELQIINTSGQVVYKSTVALKPGSNQVVLSVPSIKPGVYVGVLRSPSKTRSAKFLL